MKQDSGMKMNNQEVFEKIIMELQYVHDIVLVSEWTSSLRGIASRYCLDHSILYKSPNNS